MSDETAQPNGEIEEARQTYNRTEKWVRRVGTIFLFAAALLIFVPMVIGAIQGVQQDRVKDPFTGLPVPIDDDDMDCLDEAADLVYLARSEEGGNSNWEQRYRQWLSRCQDEHGELYYLLTRERERIGESR